MNYQPLHCHSMYSLLDGMSKPADMASRCLEIGATSCALTDHGNIAGAIKFYSEMHKNGIKPILGQEIYVCEQDAKIKDKDNAKLSHFLLLAKNFEGWKKLIRLTSEANLPEHFYRKPRLDLDTLSQFIDGNIIGICGHLGSTLARHLVQGDSINPDWKNVGTRLVSKLNHIFGKENFFLEAQLMDHENIPLQDKLTDCIRELSKITGNKIVATPDAHYCRKTDAVDQRVLLCNNLKTTFSEVNRKMQNNESVGLDAFFRSDNFHILDQEEMKALHTEEELANTNFVADMCEEYNILSKPNLPPFPCPEAINDAEYLRQLCRDGWRDKIANHIPKENHQQYVDRIKYELNVLQGADLSSYFLIVQDIVNHVRDNRWLPGPGRGSAAGCLVSYLLGITAIDPMQYGLIFDRFYNAGRNTKDRVSMPDIDIDVPIDKREHIIEYIKSTYGNDKVSQMLTFNTMKGRGALKDVLRAYGNLAFEDMNKITKNIPDEAKISDELQEMKKEYGEASIIKWALENRSNDLKEWCHLDEEGKLNGPLAKRFEQAIRLEGTKTNQSKHAAGVVIAPEALTNICPMVYDTKNKNLIAGMEMQDLENIGVIKFDILGVAVLDKIMNISDMLKQGV